MPTPADLNTYAGAAPYDGMTVHATDPDLDAGATPVAGGTVQPITMLGAGVVGPDPARYPATAGRNYTTAATFPLTEAGTYLGLWVGSTYHRKALLRHPVGPGTIPLVAAVNVRTP